MRAKYGRSPSELEEVVRFDLSKVKERLQKDLSMQKQVELGDVEGEWKISS